MSSSSSLSNIRQSSREWLENKNDVDFEGL